NVTGVQTCALPILALLGNQNSGRVAGDEKIGHFALTSIHRLWTAENELRHERQRKEFLDLSLRPKCARLQMCRHPSAPEPALLFCHHCANSACMRNNDSDHETVPAT